jgi:hypothetical protein
MPTVSKGTKRKLNIHITNLVQHASKLYCCRAHHQKNKKNLISIKFTHSQDSCI